MDENPERPAAASRLRARIARAQERAERVGRALEARYGGRPAVAIAREVLRIDGGIAGGELAGALAYRLFLWCLPFVLVVVAGLGVYADASDETPREVAGQLGLAGLVVPSVAAAASSSARWYALLIGIPALLYLTRSLLRTVVAVHRLAWGLERSRGHLTLGNVSVFLAAVVASFALTALTTGTARAGVWFWLGAASLALALRGALWLAISRRLPARDHAVTTLLPGAAVVGLGLLGVNVFTQVLVVWLGETREDSYGEIGLAATILFSLWLTSRVIVGSAVLNAAVWAYRGRDS